MDVFDQEHFFDDLVESLRKERVFRTYDKSKGKARVSGHGLKKGHDDSSKNVLGTVWHIGDEPYWPLTSSEAAQDQEAQVNPDQLLKTAKSKSIQLAIEKYMPTERFNQYLSHFCDTIGEPSHTASLKSSLRSIRRQVNLYGEVHTPKEIDKMIDKATTTANNLRAALPSSKVILELPEFPELCLSLGIFHAAHRSYLQQFEEAVARNIHLTKDERENAEFTLKTKSFRQFDDFLLFSTLMPLILHHYESGKDSQAAIAPPGCPFSHAGQPKTVISGAEPQGIVSNAMSKSVDHARVTSAINQAWETLFKKNIMRRDYNRYGRSVDENALQPEAYEKLGYGPDDKDLVDKLISEEKPASVMVCPAMRHMQKQMQSMTLEGVYKTVINDRAKYAPMIDLAREAAQEHTIGNSSTGKVADYSRY